jgi:transposase
METPEELLKRARELVLRLQSAGHTPNEIAEKLNNRVSSRTIYRWAKGEHAPQQRSDLVALERLAQSIT